MTPPEPPYPKGMWRYDSTNGIQNGMTNLTGAANIATYTLNVTSDAMRTLSMKISLPDLIQYLEDRAEDLFDNGHDNSHDDCDECRFYAGLSTVFELQNLL